MKRAMSCCVRIIVPELDLVLFSAGDPVDESCEVELISLLPLISLLFSDEISPEVAIDDATSSVALSSVAEIERVPFEPEKY